jgi:EAL domain-containing protein (putative c-di-GMP-specific phosphodiesterase class I)
LSKEKTGCAGCRAGVFEKPFSMAFQPIIDLTGGVFAYEALVRGPQGQPALSVLADVDADNRYSFDQSCRVKAIEVASGLGAADHGALLSINFLPNAVYEPRACIQKTLATAAATGFPTDHLIFEITENEEVLDHDHLERILTAYRAMGFRTAIDDFGAGFSNLNLLARFQPDLIKLDMDLIRGADRDRVRRAIIGGILKVCDEIGVRVIAEGVETVEEHQALVDLGIGLLQGYLYARPAFETLPPINLPSAERRALSA